MVLGEAASRAAFLLLASAFLLLPFQIPPELEQLGRVTRRMRQHLDRTVSHTCLETIERSRINRSGREQRHDTVRLEVAFVGDRELFSWPGASRFDDREVGDLVNGGAIGSGLFASIARAVFLGGWARFKFVGNETIGTAQTLRWDYEVPLMGSGWTIRMGGAEGKSAFSGSFWADPSTSDVVRLK